MTKLEFEKILIPLIEYIDDIELDLIKNVIERIDNYDGVKGSLEWYTDKLNELNLLDKDNAKVFKKNKNELKKQVISIAKGCGNNIDNLDKLQDYYDKGLINVNPINLSSSTAINNLTREAIKDTTDILELIQTKAIEGSNKAYKDILNKAYVETASGVYTYTESIRKALNAYAKSGIEAAHYKNGTSLSIEAVARRDVITRMNKLVGDCELEHAKELGTNLVYVDQHLGARVRTPYMKNDYEAHAEWQGKKYMIVGSNDKYDNLYEKTGYEEMLGLKGINCYHNIRPTWEWEDIPDVIDEVENAKVYELHQKQRAYERKIRTLKRERLVAKETLDNENLSKINSKLKDTISDYDKWLENNKLTRDYNREYVSNYIRSYSDNEKAALIKYISPDSISLNEKLRNKIQLSAEDKKWITNLDSALNKTPNYNGFIVRGLEMKNPFEFINQLKVNEIYSTNQYLSFSTGKVFNDNANIKIYIKNSRKAKNLKEINTISEDEVLYQRNIKFKTLNIVEKNGIVYVLWEEADDK